MEKKLRIGCILIASASTIAGCAEKVPYDYGNQVVGDPAEGSGGFVGDRSGGSGSAASGGSAQSGGAQAVGDYAVGQPYYQSSGGQGGYFVGEPIGLPYYPGGSAGAPPEE